jgi:hypothetical protein
MLPHRLEDRDTLPILPTEENQRNVSENVVFSLSNFRGCGVALSGCGMALLGCGVAQMRVRCGSVRVRCGSDEGAAWLC